MSEGRAPPSDARAPDSPSTPDALRLFEELYEELRRLASSYMRGQSRAHTLQTTALVGEAYLKLAKGQKGRWSSRGHFMAMAARAMRSVLVDHARAKRTDKRRPAGTRIRLDGLVTSIEERSASILDLDQALNTLESMGEAPARAARVVELRFLCGLSMAEIAESLDVPLRTIERDWKFARAWLRTRLT
jgi:RNA polymerase sigma factor (TIGR02999 family)